MTTLNILSGQGIFSGGATAQPDGSVLVTGSTTSVQTSWTVLPGISFVHIVCIGAGGGSGSVNGVGGGGGGLAYINNYTVTPGQVLYIQAGGAAAASSNGVGGTSYVKTGSQSGSVVLQATGGAPYSGGNYSGIAGVVGYVGGGSYYNASGASGGGGAAGYRGNGGMGGSVGSGYPGVLDGAGGGSGTNVTGGYYGGGGGMSIYGSTTSSFGSGGANNSSSSSGGGGGGSPASDTGTGKGGNGTSSNTYTQRSYGGEYGGGSGYSILGDGFSSGAVRIIWGPNRTGFPGPTTST
jgi:hypothetical protein